jgi:riboflavin synthase
MFSGIVEALGKIKNVRVSGSNIIWDMTCPFQSELYIDQSIAHNGVCLTVSALNTDSYEVTMVQETLERSNLGKMGVGSVVNLERCIKLQDRLDGHMVQGHVDDTAECISIADINGSWYFEFKLADTKQQSLIVSKGSICINGVSLTVVEPANNTFKVAIIPYTYEHTVFKVLKVGDAVNIEFDILGKYVQKHLAMLKL